MEQSPWMRIRRVYRVLMAIATIAVGALMVGQVIAIYKAGSASENLSAGVTIQPVYSREIVAESFARIAPAVYLWLCGVAIGLIDWLIQPEEAPRVKSFAGAEETLRGQRQRLPDAAQADKGVMSAVCKEGKQRRGGRAFVLRAALYAAAIALVVLGVLNGGMRDVLIKAINICTECIGLG